MNRRRYLAAAGLMAVPLAGCTTVSGETRLTADEVIEDGRSVVLPFSEDGEDVLRIQVRKQFTDDKTRGYYGFYVTSWQPDGVRLDSLQLKFRSPPYTAGFSPAGIALREDAHAHKATLSQDGDDPSTTVLDMPDTTDIGYGSVRANLLLAIDHEQDPQELWIGTEATLSDDSFWSGNYIATGDVTVEFP